MGVIMGVASGGDGEEAGSGGTIFRRKLFITGRDGVEVEIRTEAQYQAILAQMTPAELEEWKTRYRFAKIENLTNNVNYTGTGKDL